MYIKCWGARGSIPVSGKEYLRYGGDTTCIEIRTKRGDIIIIDAGTGIRRLGNYLIKNGCRQYNLLFTHAHWDHLMGLPFFKPIYRPDIHINVFRCPYPGKYVERMIARALSPPNFPVKYSDIRAKIDYTDVDPVSFDIGSVHVQSIHLSHPNGGVGYKFTEEGRSFVFLTDNELGYTHPGGLKADDYIAFAQHADILLHDAEYTPEEYKATVEWGHSSYSDALDLAIRAQVKQLGLFHINQDRTDKEMKTIVADCRKQIAMVKADITCFAVGSDMVFEL